MNELPNITFSAMSFNENIDMISMFINNEKGKENKSITNYFKNKYEEIKDIDFDKLKNNQIKEILLLKLKDKWNEEMKNSKEIVENFQNNWNKINDNVMLDLSNRLNIMWPKDALKIKARVGIMYSCPRYINERTFDTNIKYNINDMFEVAIHEVCHFLFFEKWKELYKDYDEKHYNSPHIIWYLSEALIDPLLNNETFIKYTNNEIESYKIFYDTKINGISVIDILREIFDKETIEDAIKESYNFFKNNESLIKR